MKEIELTHGYKTLVDDEDFEYLNQWKWFAKIDKRTSTVYAMRTPWKAKNPAHIRMHRLIMSVTDPKVIIDHADGNGLNNQRSNLRVCTFSQNSMNQRKTHGKSKYKGIYWAKGRVTGSWVAEIRKNGSKIYLGKFQNEIDAAKAYDKKAKEIFGEFANLNFKEDEKNVLLS